MAVEVPQNKEISGGSDKGGGKESVLIFVEEEQVGEHKH